MFIGHFASGLAARAISPESPRLGTLFIAAQLIDWGFFTFAIFGIEKMRITPGITVMNPLDLYHMPFTHSLLGAVIWAAGFALLVAALTRNVMAACITGGVVLSHWFLDLLVHRPDLTLAGHDPRFGLGLWNHPPFEIALEFTIIVGAFWLYMRRTRGPILPAMLLLGVMLAFQSINWFGPEPTSADVPFFMTALVVFGIVTALGYWVDTTRRHNGDVGLAVRR